MSYLLKHGTSDGGVAQGGGTGATPEGAAIPEVAPPSTGRPPSAMSKLPPEVRGLLNETAAALKVHPAELAALISYETGGTMDPLKAGPTTKWGQHRGLIQFGEPQAADYGVDFSSPEAAWRTQLGADGAIVKYALAHGFQPGQHNGLQLYSTINAGSPDRINASDEAAGGAPGTVADKYTTQMREHRLNASAEFGMPEGVEFSQWEEGLFDFDPESYDYGTTTYGGSEGDPAQERRDAIQEAILEGTEAAFGQPVESVMGDTSTWYTPETPVESQSLEEMAIPA